MPERIIKRQQGYAEKIVAFSQVSTADPYHQQKWVVGSSLSALTNMIDSFSPYERTGEAKQVPPPPLNAEQLTALTLYYRNAITKLEELNAAEKQGVINARTDTPEEQQKKARLQQEVEQNEQLRRTLRKDLTVMEKALTETTENGRSFSIYQIFESSRLNSGYTVKPGSVKDTTGGNINSRIPLTLVREGQQEQPGFFTKDNRVKDIPHENDIARKALDKYKDELSFLTVEDIETLTSNLRSSSKQTYNDIINYPSKVVFSEWNNVSTIMGLCLSDHTFFELIRRPEVFHMVVDVIHQYAKAKNARDLHNSVGITNEGRINRRNSAMSQVADFLGCPDVIARSENVKLDLNGETVRGTFMKKAEGSDCHNIEDDPLFLRVTPASVENLKVKKQIADLQILDYICGNPDRHGGNMMYKLVENPDGSVKLDSIQGIDNDLSFGTFMLDSRRVSAVVKLDQMNVITADMASRIMNLNEDKLRQMMYGFELTDEELKAMSQRLSRLQDKLIADSMAFSKGYGKCQLCPNRIKIVDDEELELIPFTELSYTGKHANAFGRVYANASSGVRNINDQSNQLKMAYHDSVFQFTFGDYPEMKEISKAMDKDTLWHQFRTNDYNVMNSQMKELLQDMAGFTVTPTAGAQHVAALARIKEKMIQLLTTTARYLEYKNDKPESQGWQARMDQNDPTHEPDISERRYRHAIRCKRFIQKKLKEFEILDKKLQKWNTFEQQKASRRQVYQQILNSQPKEGYSAQTKARIRSEKLKGHESRMQYILIDDILRIQKEHVPANIQTLEIQRIMDYGFAINTISPDSQIALKQEIARLNGGNQPEDNSTALKRALALHILKNRDPQPDNLLQAADEMVGNPAFHTLYQEIRHELVPDEALLTARIMYPSINKVKVYDLRYNSILNGPQQAAQNPQQGAVQNAQNVQNMQNVQIEQNDSSLNASIDSDSASFNSSSSASVKQPATMVKKPSAAGKNGSLVKKPRNKTK